MYKRSLRGWTPWGYSLIRGPIGTQWPTRSCGRGHPSVVEYFLQRNTWRRTSLQAALNQVPAISWHSGSKCDIGIAGKGEYWLFQIFLIRVKTQTSFLGLSKNIWTVFLPYLFICFKGDISTHHIIQENAQTPYSCRWTIVPMEAYPLRWCIYSRTCKVNNEIWNLQFFKQSTVKNNCFLKLFALP